MYDLKWSETFELVGVEFIEKIHWDHVVAHVNFKQVQNIRRPPLRFLEMCKLHKKFGDVVAKRWKEEVGRENLVRALSLKLKRLKVVLRQFNKEVFWDVSGQVRQASDRVE